MGRKWITCLVLSLRTNTLPLKRKSVHLTLYVALVISGFICDVLYLRLLTPPDTPLFPSLDDEAPPVNHAQRGRPRSQPITISRSSTVSAFC